MFLLYIFDYYIHFSGIWSSDKGKNKNYLSVAKNKGARKFIYLKVDCQEFNALRITVWLWLCFCSQVFSEVGLVQN